MSINLSQLFSSAAFPIEFEFLPASTVWSAPRDCTTRVTAFGGSGSGGAVRLSGFSGAATGGGAGARSTKTVKLKAGEALHVTIGAGGAGVVTSTVGVALDGNDGGDTIVTGPNGLNMVAGGGKKGSAFNGVNAALNGGEGGVATGGDENIRGGRGGNITTPTSNTRKAATGGGALPVKGVGHRGGDITGVIAEAYATGGGGIGSNAADLATAGITDGGGTHMTGSRVIVPPLTGLPVLGWLRACAAGGLATNTSGGSSQLGKDGDVGAGSGGFIGTSNGIYSVGTPGAFSGQGGIVATSNGSILSSPLSVVTYGGSGGALTASSGPVSSAPGGGGLVVLEIL